MEQYGIECAATLRVGEDDDPKILLGHQHDARHESRYPASVSDQFAPAIIAQPPTERVGCKVRSQARKWAWLVACGEDGLRGPHLLTLRLREQPCTASRKFAV